MINITASEDGNSLVVRQFCDKHNHEVSKVNTNYYINEQIPKMVLLKELFRQLPQQRKLTMEETKKAKNLLQLKANKKMVKDDLQSSTGKIVLLKDLSNLMSTAKIGL